MTGSKISAKPFFCIVVSAILFTLGIAETFAQELEPRSYANTPVGINIIGAAFGIAQGNVLLDPALPVEDLGCRK